MHRKQHQTRVTGQPDADMGGRRGGMCGRGAVCGQGGLDQQGLCHSHSHTCRHEKQTAPSPSLRCLAYLLQAHQHCASADAAHAAALNHKAKLGAIRARCTGHASSATRARERSRSQQMHDGMVHWRRRRWPRRRWRHSRWRAGGRLYCCSCSCAGDRPAVMLLRAASRRLSSRHTHLQ